MNVLIVGAGAAAAGAALALSNSPDVKITVLDIGGQLENENNQARQRMSATDSSHWQDTDLSIVSQTAVPTQEHRLPEKRIFGSDFPFRDFGQLSGIRGEEGVNAHVVSGAFGGFTNTWGAQTMVFSEATFDDWPFARGEIERDYRAILGMIPYSAEVDDLAEYFPLWGIADNLPPLGESADRILRAYERHRIDVRRHGVLVGKARLALHASKCVLCGLCMTGCPYGLVYSASQTFDEMIARGQVGYVGGYLALQVGEEKGRPFVKARSLSSGEVTTFTADKILLACGSIGTTRLVAHSLEQWSTRIHMLESAQFLMPMASLKGISRLTQAGTFTLNQFNLVLPFDESGHDIVQIHGYPYNDAMDDALPGILQSRALEVLRTQTLKHLTVGLGYLPSWWSPGFDVVLEPPHDVDQLPALTLTPSTGSSSETKSRLREVTKRLLKCSTSLGIAPVVSQVALSSPGKSYHFGGSFAHAANPVSERQSDALGRVGAWSDVHLVDASVFSNVPATTFTLTIMANAHRIARMIVDS
jgi:choline dehydrogenase-like flavoprotein